MAKNIPFRKNTARAQYIKEIPILLKTVSLADINFQKVSMPKLFEALMEEYCDKVPQTKYEKTLTQIGKWMDEARKGYGLK